jgi:hypothetical protein
VGPKSKTSATLDPSPWRIDTAAHATSERASCSASTAVARSTELVTRAASPSTMHDGPSS